MTTYQTTPDDVRGQSYRPAERRTFTETKLGAKTSEFYMAIIAIAGIIFATYVDGDDSLVKEDGMFYAALVAIAYIVSRGLAKLGTREPYADSETA